MRSGSRISEVCLTIQPFRVGNARSKKLHYVPDMKLNISTTAKPTEDKMAMLDWNEYRKQILSRVGEIGKLSPDTVKGYAALGGAGTKTGHLDAKTRANSSRLPWQSVCAATAVSPFTMGRQRSSAPPRKKSPRHLASESASTPALRSSTLLARLMRSMRPLETLAAETVVLHLHGHFR